MKQGFFSSRIWVLRFLYAVHGLAAFFKTEHNAIVYSLATIGVAIFSLVFNFSATEAFILLIVTGIVWVCELFNTAIERLADIVSPQQDMQIKVVKDVAAAAVFLSAIIALIAGLIIFTPKIF